MVHVKNSILIEKDLAEVFKVAADFESYPEFIPTYKSVQILERQGDELLIERVGLAGGREVKWRSRVVIKENKSIKAVQLEGPLAGMEIEWSFEEAAQGTLVLLTHNFEYRKIPLIGSLIGRLIVKRIVSRMADDTLKAIKKRVER